MRRFRVHAAFALAAPMLAISGCGLPILDRAPPPPPPPVIAAPVIPAYVHGDVIGGRAARVRRARAAGLKLLAPGAVFDYVNRQEIDLRRQTAGTGVDVIRSGELLLLRLPATGAFDVGRADIRPQAASTISEIGLTLKRFNQSMVDVLGHTDPTGNPASNQALSERRAQAVANHLKARGVVAARLSTRGYAAAHPIAGNDTETGRATNRRVEIKVVPLR